MSFFADSSETRQAGGGDRWGEAFYEPLRWNSCGGGSETQGEKDCPGGGGSVLWPHASTGMTSVSSSGVDSEVV